MKKKKQYLHQISLEVLSDKDLLNQWFSENDDISVLGLTADIMYDDKLLFEWLSKIKNSNDFFDSLDENKLNKYFENFIKDNPDFDKIGFDINFFEKNIDSYNNMITTLEIMDKDSLNSGISLEDIRSFRESERKRVATNLELQLRNLTTNEKFEYYKNIIPFFEKIFNKEKKEFYKLKSKSLLEFTEKETNKVNDISEPKKTHEKWFALLYWIELMATGKQPPRSIEGTFVKSKIQQIGSNYTGTSGQSFYKSFIEIDLNNQKLLNNNFGQDWKSNIIKLSNNNPIIIEYINSKYN